MSLKYGDCLDHLKDLTVNSVDALITDPPAGISFMGKDWDSDLGDRDSWILWLRTIMREAHRVMKPGAHGLVWAIPRTSHWTATALEDAGFEIRDVVTHLFGSGFPKSLDISKAIDKAAGAEREIVGPKVRLGDKKAYAHNDTGGIFEPGGQKDNGFRQPITIASTPEAKQYSGWGTALKPASEHWILIRKPCSEKTVAKNVLKWGVGGINIDGCRVDYQSEADKSSATPQGTVTSKKPKGGLAKAAGVVSERNEFERPALIGRFPANLILDEVAAEMLDEQSGVLKSGNLLPGHKQTGHGDKYSFRADAIIKKPYGGDSGGASRFFYCAKASKRERGEGNSHPTVKASKLMEYLITLITPPNGIILDPFMGSGSTGVAAKKLGFKFIGIEKEKEYFEIAKRRVKA